MDETQRGEREAEEQRELEREQLGGPADYDESGGTGLEPGEGDEVIGGGVSGSDEDPIGEPGIPDEVAPRLRPRER
jgi:hypothetical protein